MLHSQKNTPAMVGFDYANVQDSHTHNSGIKQDIIIIGTSDTADRIVSFIRRYDLFNIVACAVDEEFLSDRTMCSVGGMTLPLYSIESLPKLFDMTQTLVFIAILWNRLNADRKKLYSNLKDKGFHFANVISPLSSFRGDRIGDNCYIGDFCVIHERVEIGNNVWLMDSVLACHRCVINDHVFVAPGATILGAAKIGCQSFIGARATVFDETVVGEKCIIGATTGVNRNLEPYSVIKANISFSTTIKRYNSDEIESKWLAHHNVR